MRLDTTNIRIIGEYVRIQGVIFRVSCRDVREWVVTQEVLVQPGVEGSTVDCTAVSGRGIVHTKVMH